MDNTMAVRPVQSDSLGTILVPLLALVIFINYVDRGSLAITAPLIRDQLHFSSTQIGILLSSFFWTYVPAQILAGWLSERISPCRILALGLALWSFATIGLGVVNQFAGFLLFRILLGIGESAAFPCSSKLLASHVAPQQLGKANGLISVGMGIGPAFGTMAGGLLLAHRVCAVWRGLTAVAVAVASGQPTGCNSGADQAETDCACMVTGGALPRFMGGSAGALLHELRVLFRSVVVAAVSGQGARSVN